MYHIILNTINNYLFHTFYMFFFSAKILHYRELIEDVICSRLSKTMSAKGVAI